MPDETALLLIEPWREDISGRARASYYLLLAGAASLTRCCSTLMVQIAGSGKVFLLVSPRYDSSNVPFQSRITLNDMENRFNAILFAT
ncbi:MAG TPA: hypothetical protein VN828_09185 [Acidobacteriaceae bacterium]|nr:hypothetical protein [Acidobacteriaceae bacterium]